MSGRYWPYSTSDGVTSYRRSPAGYYLFRDPGTHTWHIATTHGSHGPDHFVHDWAGALNGRDQLYDGMNAWSGYALVGWTPITERTVSFDTTPPVPDCQGTYDLVGLYGGKPYWYRDDSAYAIFWSDTMGTWTIADAPPAETPVSFWSRATRNGIYAPTGYTGNPLLSQPT